MPQGRLLNYEPAGQLVHAGVGAIDIREERRSAGQRHFGKLGALEAGEKHSR